MAIRSFIETLSFMHPTRLAVISFAMLVGLSLPTVSTAGELAGVRQSHSVDIPAWFKSSFLDISDDVKEAAAAGKRVILFFHQDGCGSCQRFYKETFGDRQVFEKTQQHFDVIAIDINGPRSVTAVSGEILTEEEFARSVRGQVTPTLLFLNERGEVVVRLPGFSPPARFAAVLDYVASREEKRGGLDDYLKAKGL